MEKTKPLEFHGGALGFFILTLLTGILFYIPFVGWAVMLNYTGGWFAENSLVNGKKVVYQAGFGESLKFVSINFLLLLITLSIYQFWFYPKMYRYMVDHTHYADDLPEVPEVATAAPEATKPAETNPQPPAPTAPLVQ